MAPEVPSMMYSFGGKVSPSWSAQPTRKLFPGPCTMLVGMQLGMGKVFSTNGPSGLPRFGLMTSTVPTVRAVGLASELVTRKRPEFGLNVDPPIPAIEVAPTQPADGGAWLAQNDPSGLIIGPWWQGLSGPRIFTPAP